MTTYHVYVGDHFVGLISAESQEKAESSAKSRWGKDVHVTVVRYRSEEENK